MREVSDLNRPGHMSHLHCCDVTLPHLHGESIASHTGWPLFGYGSCVERFERFRASVPTVPPGKGFLGTSVELKNDLRKARFRFRFQFLKAVPAVSGSSFGSWKKTVPTVPV